PETSQQIVSKKVENAKATGADLWVTGCPGCSINLAGNLQETDTLSVEHILMLIERGIKK
ncbi:(Fe-S)-binding protein, partial [bacterium]|nr:(Fe-S)-binding protein [bacterium]